jgi:predicted nuclease of predicted toxin-antitoxin system
VKFLIDMPLSPGLVPWLVQQGHEAVHAIERGLARAPDEAILDCARKEGSVIITADLDYPRLLALTQSGDPGLILLRGGDYNEEEAIEHLRQALKIVPADELPNSIVVIEKGRIRRRRLLI